MIETATARRVVGDWAGACAAARVDAELDLRTVARRYGRELASQVRDQVSKADEMVIQIRKINKDVKDRSDQAKDEAITSSGASLRDRLSTIEEEIYQVRNRANEDPLNFPIKLNNIIAALARSIETGDNPPTDQDYEVFRVLTSRFNVVEAKFNEVLQKDLAQYNQLLASHKLPQIRASESTDHQ